MVVYPDAGASGQLILMACFLKGLVMNKTMVSIVFSWLAIIAFISGGCRPDNKAQNVADTTRADASIAQKAADMRSRIAKLEMQINCAEDTALAQMSVASENEPQPAVQTEDEVIIIAQEPVPPTTQTSFDNSTPSQNAVPSKEYYYPSYSGASEVGLIL